MSDATELRRKAALLRRVASIPTSGGMHTDRVLIGLAERLDSEAARVERQSERSCRDVTDILG
jgi:hypothetical protein